MIDVTVEFCLSTAGQKDALKRGLPAMAKQTITGTFDPTVLDHCSITDKGNVFFDGITLANGRGLYLDQYPDTAGHVIDAVAAKNKKWEAEKKQQVQENQEREARKREDRERASREEITKNGPAAGIDKSQSWNLRVKKSVPADLRAAVQTEIDAQVAAQRAENERGNRENKLRREKEEAETALRKAHAVAYVRSHGTANQIERLDAEQLPVAEIWELIKRDTFTAYAEFERYELMRGSDFENDYGEVPDDLEFESQKAKKVTAEQWDLRKEIQAIDPRAAVEIRLHWAEADGEILENRYGIRVERKNGPCLFTREFAAPGREE